MALHVLKMPKSGIFLYKNAVNNRTFFLNIANSTYKNFALAFFECSLLILSLVCEKLPPFTFYLLCNYKIGKVKAPQNIWLASWGLSIQKKLQRTLDAPRPPEIELIVVSHWANVIC